MSDRFAADLQSEKQTFAIPLDLVGLEGVKKRLDIHRPDGHYSINVVIKALIDLPATQRGAHMSRSVESIDECIQEHAYAPRRNLEAFGVDIATTMLDRHEYATVARVEMEGPFIVQARPREGKESSQAAYYLKLLVVATRNPAGSGPPLLDITVGAVADGMIACPCGQEMSREFAKEVLLKREDLHLDETAVDTILNIVPVATHNQRATGEISMQVPVPGVVDVLDIVDTIEASMSGRICGVLKRPEEAHLIRLVHQDPLFTEDVLRRMAYNIATDRFKQVPDGMRVSLRLVSMESIHPHEVSAGTTTTMGALRAARAITGNGTCA